MIKWKETFAAMGKPNSGVPKPFSLFIGISVLGLTGLGLYWWYDFSGLYRALVNFQIDLMGKYYAFYSAVFTIFILLIPVIIVNFLITAYYINYSKENTEDSPSLKENGLAKKINHLAETKPLFFKFYVLSLGLTIAAFAGSMYHFIVYGPLSSQAIITDISSTKIVEEKTTEHITIDALLQCGDMYYIESGSGSKSKTSYTPIADTSGKFRNIFLKIGYNPDLDCIDSLTTITGIIHPADLPGLVRDEYIKMGLISSNENYSVIDDKTSPIEKKKDAWDLLIVTGIGLSLFLLLHYKDKIFSKKN
jgi:hypothetical protein